MPFDLVQPFRRPPHQANHFVAFRLQPPYQRAADETRGSGHGEFHTRNMTPRARFSKLNGGIRRSPALHLTPGKQPPVKWRDSAIRPTVAFGETAAAGTRGGASSNRILVELLVGGRGLLPTEVAAHPTLDGLADPFWLPVELQRPVQGLHEFPDQRREHDSRALRRMFIDVDDRVDETAHPGHDGDRAVRLAVHLVEAARLETRRHEKEIRARLDQVTCLLVVLQAEGDLLRVRLRQVAEGVFKPLLTRAALLKKMGMDEAFTGPVFGMICRLTEQKGLDLVLAAKDFFIGQDCRLIVLGTGEKRFENALRDLAQAHPKKIALSLKHDEEASHLIEAGADFLLMPSRFEPCGLNQMYSQAYGTIPVVTRVGGFIDTVVDVDEH